SRAAIRPTHCWETRCSCRPTPGRARCSRSPFLPATWKIEEIAAMRHPRKSTHPSQQRGVVLFVALILLLILSLLGVTAARMQTTEERMARNEDNRQIGAQAAEAALRAAEAGLTSGVYPPAEFAGNANGFYELNPANGSVLQGPPVFNWSTAGAAITYPDPANPMPALALLPTAAQSPKYI